MSHKITAKVAQEIIFHEAIVREAYKDSVGVWTWGIGITNASGHKVYPRYIDNPQTIKRCLEIFEWVLRKKYVPAVDEAFRHFDLTEEQFAAALSFHYNTGGIKRATWVKQWKNGETENAYQSMLNWNKPPAIIPRRKKEQALFFHGTWSNNGMAMEYDVRKPGYSPDWASAKTVEISSVLSELFD
ncbi:lysozyme [bacterium]|nr:lysozyme [bacterium]